jgi:hypothetical protein
MGSKGKKKSSLASRAFNMVKARPKAPSKVRSRTTSTPGRIGGDMGAKMKQQAELRKAFGSRKPSTSGSIARPIRKSLAQQGMNTGRLKSGMASARLPGASAQRVGKAVGSRASVPRWSSAKSPAMGSRSSVPRAGASSKRRPSLASRAFNMVGSRSGTSSRRPSRGRLVGSVSRKKR